MTANEIRQSFLDYFASHGHRIVPSSSLVPGDDPTLLFTNAGMNQFKDLFLGREQREYRRAATAQKCMRVSGKHNDLENVGPSLRHHTFFEMLGNFSFGDYFKQEAIPFAWSLLTDVWHLPPDRLYPTIFKGDGGIARDEDAYAAWRQLVPADRIAELGLSENFWQMGETGPCGRCSEIHYFRGNDVPCEEPVCRGVACSCERYLEIWNNVFMEFDRDASGRLTPLPAPSIDTGMGLERITAVIQGVPSNYDTDLLMPILRAIAERARRPYAGTGTGSPDHPDVSMRVIADHLRAMTFLIADGVTPSNEWRGYVLRKIMRRAMRHGKRLGIAEPFLYELVDVVAREMGGAYPDLRTGQEAIVRTVRAEEERFDAVLISGLPRLEEVIDRVVAAGATIVPGGEIFRLYDSLGVPYDFAEDLAGQRGLAIDREGYDRAMQVQRERARARGSFKLSPASLTIAAETDRLLSIEDEFARDEPVDCAARVVALLLEDGRQIETLETGATGLVVLDRTPFYLEAGGQVSDEGVLEWPGGRAMVDGVLRGPVRPRLHHVAVTVGQLTAGVQVTASIDMARRQSTMRNHTATHLLHAALRQRLGTHVRQAGSLVAPDRLRFDFAHYQPLRAEEQRDIERLVNEQIYRNATVGTEIRATEDAIRAGATALFGEKYGDTVRVVTVPDFSVELCGGTHVRATGEIGPFVIVEESGVAAGVRRIEALTGAGAVAYRQEREASLIQAMATLGVPGNELSEAALRLQHEVKRLTRENTQLKTKLALGQGREADEDAVTVAGGIRLIARHVSGLERDALRGLSDSLRDRLGQGVVVLAGENEGKVQVLVSVTRDLTDRIKAGQLVKQLAPIVGGGGGGRPDFAEAGGRDASKIGDLLVKARELVAAALG